MNADRFIATTYVRLRMGHPKEMRIVRKGKKYCRKCDNCSETELTPDQIFNCSAIIQNLLKICVLLRAIDLYEDNIILIVKAIIDP